MPFFVSRTPNKVYPWRVEHDGVEIGVFPDQETALAVARLIKAAQEAGGDLGQMVADLITHIEKI